MLSHSLDFISLLIFAFTHVFYFVFKVHMLSCNAESSHKCSTAHYSQVVGLGGLEPPTSRLSGVRSNHLSYKPMFLIHSRESLKRIGIRFSQTCGGDKRDRTADPLLAKQVLSQLSYTPISRVENP